MCKLVFIIQKSLFLESQKKSTMQNVTRRFGKIYVINIFSLCTTNVCYANLRLSGVIIFIEMEKYYSLIMMQDMTFLIKSVARFI